VLKEELGMSLEENKNIALRFIQVWGDGDLDMIEQLAAPSLSVHYPIMPKTVQGNRVFRKVMENFRSAFPDSRLITDEVIAEGDKVVIRWNFSGTHQGALLNLPASGKMVKWTGITIYRIIDQKIVEERGEEDFLGFLRQIGVVR
jgi:steroid delta-isomerase-like uncharacterized protein